MSRIIYYSVLYLISLLIFVFSGFSSGLEGLLFLTFLLSTLWYTFTLEGLPSKDLLKYPEAFKYKTTRVNLYGDGMLITLVISSLLIGLNFSFRLLNNSIFILLVWPLIIGCSYYLAILHKKRKELYSTYDYVNFKLNKKVELKLVKLILQNYEKSENLEQLVKISCVASQENESCTPTLLRETAHAVSEFKKASENAISYEEIKTADTKIVK